MTGDQEILFESYLDGDLHPEQVAELIALLENQPAARSEFLRFIVLETQLAEAVLERDEVLRSDELRESLGFDAVVTARRGNSGSVRPAATRAWRRSWLAVASIAAALSIAVGVWSVLPQRSQASHQLLAGRVLIDNGQGENQLDLPAGSTIRVAGDEPAEIQLSDGSQVEFEPASRAVLRGASGGLRQVVELVEGAGTFRVRKGGGQFQIKTSIGDVTVLGTEFSVELFSPQDRLPPSQTFVDGEPLDDPNSKGVTMKKELLLAVVVFSGLVQVDFNGKAYALKSGDSKVVGGEIKAPAVGENPYLDEMTEFFDLTPAQRQAFPAAAAAHKKAYQDMGYAVRSKQLRDDRAAGRLDDKAYVAARGALKYERAQILAGTGTLDQILTDKQRVDWGAFQQYRNIVPTLRRKGIELSDDQIAAIRQQCRVLAAKLAIMNPSEAYYSKWSVFRELQGHVEGKVLTKGQRAKLANATQAK